MVGVAAVRSRSCVSRASIRPPHTLRPMSDTNAVCLSSPFAGGTPSAVTGGARSLAFKQGKRGHRRGKGRGEVVGACCRFVLRRGALSNSGGGRPGGARDAARAPRRAARPPRHARAALRRGSGRVPHRGPQGDRQWGVGAAGRRHVLLARGISHEASLQVPTRSRYSGPPA